MHQHTSWAGILKQRMAVMLFICASAAYVHAEEKNSSTQSVHHSNEAVESSSSVSKAQSADVRNLFPVATVPKHDLVVVSSRHAEGEWVMVADSQALGQMIGFASMMSMIPPSGATFYLKGYPVDQTSLPIFLDKKRAEKTAVDKSIKLFPAKRRQQIFNDDGLAYTEKREQLQQTPGRYILEQDVIEEFYYLDAVLPATSEVRSLLREKRGFVLKGEHAHYRVGEASDFLANSEPGVRTEWETPGGQELIQLRLYFHNNDELSYEQIFTQKDAQALFGQKYVIKTSPRYNKTLKLAWLEFD
jgi:hypothetical protein